MILNAQLGPIVGHVSNEQAKIWIRGEEGKKGIVRFRSPDGEWHIQTFALDSELDYVGVAYLPIHDLASPVSYEIGILSITSSSQDLTEADWTGVDETCRGSFRKPGNANAGCTFLLGSCHHRGYGPWSHGDQAYGAMLRSEWAKNADFMMLGGDQVYCDKISCRWIPVIPGIVSDVPKDDKGFFKKYRQDFSLPNFRDVTRNLPTYMIFDDHEIADNWRGYEFRDTSCCKKKHRDLSILDSGLKAYWAYQGIHSNLRVAPVYNQPDKPMGGMHNEWWYTFERGIADFFVLDCRHRREHPLRAGATMLGEKQKSELKAFLKKDNASRWKFVVSPVPLAPDTNEKGEKADTWKAYPAERNEILDFIRTELDYSPIFLSGDIHLSCVTEIRHQDNPSFVVPCITSSALNWFVLGVADVAQPYIPFKQPVVTDGPLINSAEQLLGHGEPSTGPYRAEFRTCREQRNNFVSISVNKERVKATIVRVKGGVESDTWEVSRAELKIRNAADAGELSKTFPAAQAASARKVAIIAVHGVGSQMPNETARSLASLMLRSGITDGDRFTHFDEHKLMLPTATIKDELGLGVGGVERVNGGRFIEYQTALSPEGKVDLDTEFSKSCVSEYDASRDSRSYETVVLSGRRLDVNGVPGGERLDIYEMHWADLSSLKGNLAALLGGIYQLLLHVGSLARTTADALYIKDKEKGVLLGFYRWLVAAMVWVITVPFPIVNLGLFCLALSLAPLNIPASSDATMKVIVYAIVPLLAFGLGFFLLQIYDRRRPGAMIAGLFLLGLVPIVVVIRSLATAGVGYGHVLLNIGEVYFMCLWLISILLFFAFFLFLFASACMCWRKEQRSSVATIFSALVLPLGLFCLLTVMIWGGLQEPLAKSMEHAEGTYLPFFEPESGCNRTAAEFLVGMLSRAGSSTFDFFLYGALAALVIAILGLACSGYKEFSSPDISFPSSAKAVVSTEEWLNGAFKLLWPTAIAVFAFTFAVAIGRHLFVHFEGYPEVIRMLGNLKQDPWVGWLVSAFYEIKGGNTQTLQLGLYLVAGGSAVFLTIIKLFQKNLGSLRAVIDVALDVDNWMRERPLDSNPRARIFSRYMGLLKHVNAQGYDRVLVVAHSQGTVITADLFRLLKTSRHTRDVVTEDKFRLITAGSPLRQLYAARFAAFYNWICGNNTRSELGVGYWLNLYRGGDYVGRTLWMDPLGGNVGVVRHPPTDSEALVNALYRTPSGTLDCCIGDGAHTRYFDHTATPVGKIIDRMLR